MYIHRVSIKNFRLLVDVELILEKETTVIVGRNNSGKTSLSEVIRRFLSERAATFQLEDFSSASYDRFWQALNAHNERKDEREVRSLIPSIELRLLCGYEPTMLQLGPLSPFVIDLDPDCSEALIVVSYELRDGGIAKFFQDLPSETNIEAVKIQVLRSLRERIPAAFTTKVWAEDPNDSSNRRLMQPGALRTLIMTGFINAQRGLDDMTSRESDVLAKVLEGLFTTANTATADERDRLIAEALKASVGDIQSSIDKDFAAQLKSLLPVLNTFGYPGLGDQELHTETTLDVQKLLTNFTKVRYAAYSGLSLPESYNGLGVRNLIFILLQLAGFYKKFRAEPVLPGMHVIFIEEPEAHLHPQMQEVFIRQLTEVAKQLVGKSDKPVPWPVQFVVSTHSSHVANEVGFESIRYFLGTQVPGVTAGVRHTKIKDLRTGLRDTPVSTKEFLHQYLTLSRCDLFFADKAALVEGLTERLLFPVVIQKLEEAEPDEPKLSSQYMTIMEVGGAYAHLFFDLLRFLELRCLIVTDIDSVAVAGGKACAVHQGATTSNPCLKAWFDNEDQVTIDSLKAKTTEDKTKGRHRITYQCAETTGGPCGRTFEDAFILANGALFNLNGSNRDEQELNARDIAEGIKKSEFALKYAISETNWVTPRYLLDGIRWLRQGEISAIDPALETAIKVVDQAPLAEPKSKGAADA